MPKVFRVTFPNARVIINATEFAVERPSSLVSQAGTFSSYKHRNTVKVLIGITPSGAVSFVSQTFEGSISVKQLTAQSGLLDKLEDGDDILADKGFVTQDLLAPLGVRLHMPPFLSSGSEMAPDNVILTKNIARLRIHVERAIGQLKNYIFCRVLFLQQCGMMFINKFMRVLC